MESVTFRNGTVDLAGNVYFPGNFDETGSTKHAALVCVHPGSSVKEQTAGLYARRMAGEGYVTLVFDASKQGESGGEPRYAEEPAARVEDIRCAVDFLTTLPYVDDERIGILGICAGGGYAVNAAMTEHRIRAVGVVSVINIGRARREAGSALDLLDAVGRQRTIEARGGQPLITNWTPGSPEEAREAGLTDIDIIEAVDYYRTPRGQHERASNQLRFTSVASVLAFDAFQLAEDLLTQPLQIIVGSRTGAFGSYSDGHDLFRRVTCEKDLLVIHGASHYDLYDQPEYVDQAVGRLAAFYDEHLPEPHAAGGNADSLLTRGR